VLRAGYKISVPQPDVKLPVELYGTWSLKLDKSKMSAGTVETLEDNSMAWESARMALNICNFIIFIFNFINLLRFINLI
jgi:hypothetical protein